jgi:hypothetical protein
MATIQLSSTYNGFIGTQGTGQFVSVNSTSNANIISGCADAGVSLLLIYKGSIAAFPALTDRSTRASDLLITFTLPSTAGGWSSLGVINQGNRYLFGKCPTLTTASASGLATWFILCRSGTTSMTDKGAMMGTVGSTGAGADLSIGNTNVVSGTTYQSSGFYINLPQVWTV